MKTCKRCGNKFDCKSDNIENCFCSRIKLSEATSSFLSKTTFDCLCKSCLTEINNLVEESKMLSFPKNNDQFLKDLHYYINENGYWVFTELHHILRGTCCENNCKHCPYGFTKKTV